MGVETNKICCAPVRVEPSQKKATSSQATAHVASTGKADIARVAIPGGVAMMGTEFPQILDDGEDPVRMTELPAFTMSETAITNAEFAEFVADTGHVTTAEEWGWSFVFHKNVPKRLEPTMGIAGLEWWRQVYGANWRDINGPGTADECWHEDHPVVQISYHDAAAFARWAGGRLPSEAEWEHAARGGLGDVKYPWGDDEPTEETNLLCNHWQGRFPHLNTGADGYQSTAPARSFAPNGYGLYNMVGNVWEWTATPFNIQSDKPAIQAKLAKLKGYRTGKGGSYLCHKSYCYRYRIAARSPQDETSTAPHQGMRVVWDA